MRLQGREVSPTRASQLALRDEQKLIHEGYEFLDEKRMLLAQELLRQVALLRALNERREDARKKAKDALVAATMHHGLEDVSLYPPPFGAGLMARTTRRNYLGLSLVETSLVMESPTNDIISQPGPQPGFPSHEAPVCAQAFRELIAIDVERAALSANLHRLMREYVTTERRARALENVLLPEIGVAVKQIGEHLEAADQEEALLVRHAKVVV